MKKFLSIIAISFLILGRVSTSLAQSLDPSQAILSNVALFNRCYSALTGVRAAASHPILLQVKNSGLDPVAGCMQVFDKGTLVPAAQSNLTAPQLALVVPSNPANSYTPYVLQNVADADGLAVLNRFQNFHRQLFQISDLSKLPAYSTYLDRFNDPTEPALYLTRILFQPGLQYREAVTGNYAVRGIRSLGPWTRDYYVGGSDIHNMTSAGTGLDRGLLWGVGAYTPQNANWFRDDGTPESTFSWTNGSGGTFIYYTFGARRAYGGGILGLHSYIVMNSGFPSQNSDDPSGDPTEINSGRSNASRRMMRRLTASVMQDLLGRPLPPLRPEDVSNLVANYVQHPPVPASNTLPFRKSSSCAACHASLDSMAAIWRAFYFDRAYFTPWILPQFAPGGVVSPTVDFISAESLRSGYVAPLPAETPLNSEYTMMGRDPNFYRRPASGDLRFRSYDGTLVWQHIAATGQFDALSQLGQALAGTNDLYVSIAARYFKFFTGIQVNLQDIGASANPALSQDDLYYRNVVIGLGLHLKDTQSLRSLVQEIFNLPLYKKIGLRDLTT